jgi:hypothetical protein
VESPPELVEGTAEDEGEVLLRFREGCPGAWCAIHFVLALMMLTTLDVPNERQAAGS